MLKIVVHSAWSAPRSYLWSHPVHRELQGGTGPVSFHYKYVCQLPSEAAGGTALVLLEGSNPRTLLEVGGEGKRGEGKREGGCLANSFSAFLKSAKELLE